VRDIALPGLADIEAAENRIAGVASKTPLVESPPLSRLTGSEVYLKLECFQPVKVFKIRGAFNRISQVREPSVVAASSGNHGIAVAYSSHLLGKRCTVVVPETAVKEKIDAIKDYGAEVLMAGRLSDEREEKARRIAEQTESAFIHPFDDAEVIAGQGTCGLEIHEQLADFDAVVVPVGGGGLISGVSIALKSKRPHVKVYGVEPAAAPKLTAALAAKEPTRVAVSRSLADGLLPSALGKLTYDACSRFVDGAFTASEDEIIDATRTMATVARVIAEPSGATPLVPLLRGAALGTRVVVVISGGNISLELLKRILP
jgi:threonine dehydratase